jgi:hypothetical protein
MSPFKIKLATNCCFSLENGWIERQRIKVKRADKISGGFEFLLESSFYSPIFFSYWMIDPFSFPKFNFNTKSYFPYFSVSFSVRE